MSRRLVEMKKLAWKRYALYGFLVFILVLGFYFIYLGWIKKDMSDFSVCYRGGERIVQGETLYRVEDGHLQFKYAPLAAAFFSVFTFFPYEIAKIIWYYSEIIFLFACFFISYRLLPTKEKGKWFVIGLGLMILAKYAGREVELGQVNIFIIFILTLMLAALLKRKDTLAGLLWSCSLFFKPYALVFLPYFLLKKRYKVVVSGLIIILAGLLFVPLLFYSFKGNLSVLQEWTNTLSLSTPGLIMVYDNASLYAFFLKVFPGLNKKLIELFLTAVFLVMGFSFLWMMKAGKKQAFKKPEVLEVSVLLILIPLFSPLGWYYNYLYSIVAVIVLLNYLRDFPSLLKYILLANFVAIGGSLREVLGKDLFHFYNRYSLMVLNYLLVLFYLFYLRFKKYSRI